MSDASPGSYQQPQFQVWQQSGPFPGFYLPAGSFNAADSAFHGAAMYPGLVYLVAQTPAPAATMGYAKRTQGDDNTPLNFFYQVAGQFPGYQKGAVGGLWDLIQMVRQKAGYGGKYEIKAYNANDNTWVYYFNNGRQPLGVCCKPYG